MTTREPDIDARDTDAKLAAQRHEQLSALLDGELAPEQARFLLRRLAHDESLAGRLERWQVAGDLLRGQPLRIVPGSARFPARVAAAVAGEPAARPRAGAAGWRRAGGFAVAASVAALAFVLMRPLPGDGPAMPPTASAPDMAASAPGDAAPPPERDVTVPQFTDAGRALAGAGPDAGAAAAPARRGASPAAASLPVASLPAATAQSADIARAPAGAASPPAATTQPGPAMDDVGDGAGDLQVASAAPAGQDLRPFAPAIEPQARPWPRAALTRSAGTLTVGFDDEAPASFYPFEPQLPEDTQR